MELSETDKTDISLTSKCLDSFLTYDKQARKTMKEFIKSVFSEEKNIMELFEFFKKCNENYEKLASSIKHANDILKYFIKDDINNESKDTGSN